MSTKILRNYLHIETIKDLKEVKNPLDNFLVSVVKDKDFQLNKFFYKNIGKNCEWVDRLIWTDINWMDHLNDERLFTYILKDNEQMAGYFELIYEKKKEECEIAYFGILDEYFGKGLGGYLLSEAIKESFKFGCKRVIVHTCSLDHKNALKNYISRGMKIFKSETLIR